MSAALKEAAVLTKSVECLRGALSWRDTRKFLCDSRYGIERELINWGILILHRRALNPYGTSSLIDSYPQLLTFQDPPRNRGKTLKNLKVPRYRLYQCHIKRTSCWFDYQTRGNSLGLLLQYRLRIILSPFFHQEQTYGTYQWMPLWLWYSACHLPEEALF